MTNIGLFRNYAELYLKSNPLLNVEMTTMVRQLQPTELGIPLEIYCFSKNQEWIAYEQLSSDLFDHLIAVSTKGTKSLEFDVFFVNDFPNFSCMSWLR